MRRLAFSLFCLVTLLAQAQYKTMLKPGRYWQMSHHRIDLFAQESAEQHTIKPYTLYVGEMEKDDDGHECYTIIYGDERSDVEPYPIALVYEEGGKLYEHPDDCAMPPSPRLVLDLTPEAGGKYPIISPSINMEYQNVQKVDSIMVNGELCKRIHLGKTGYENDNTYLVEGIGISNDNLLWYKTYYDAATNGIIEWSTLDAVYDDGSCIFSASDFSKPAYNEPKDDTEPDFAGIWSIGSQWSVFTEEEAEGDSPTSEMQVRYRLLPAEGDYMALEKTEIQDGVKGTPEVIGYVRNEGNAKIYVRPVSANGSIGEESLLYDFSTPFEYGNTVRYGVEGGDVKTDYIDWQKGSLDYYMLSGDDRVLPAWDGIIYRYGYIGGPMELFQRRCAPGKTKEPKATNISHVIFSTKKGNKVIRRSSPASNDEIAIPYTEMLTDGTKWECLAVSRESSEAARTYTIEVKGDTLIENRICKKAYSSEFKADKVVFEEGRKLYIVSADNVPEVVLDFGMKQGDALDEVAFVLDVNTIENLGYTYRTISVDTGLECQSYFAGDTTPWSYTLIEGIGVSKDEHLYTHCILEEENAVSYLLRSWNGGTLVYQSPFYDASVGIGEIQRSGDNAIFYDLQGRRLGKITSKGLYIHGNKKVFCR